MELYKEKRTEAYGGEQFAGYEIATKSDILHKAKELIEVGEIEIDNLLFDIYHMVADNKIKNAETCVSNFVSSLFESNNSQINKEV